MSTISKKNSIATLRYYEKLGLIASEREGSSESEHRRYRESTFLKIRYITIGQRAGFSLDEIAAQLATLPDRFPLPKKDWAPMSRVWDERIDQRIAAAEDRYPQLRLRPHEGASAQSLGLEPLSDQALT